MPRILLLSNGSSVTSRQSTHVMVTAGRPYYGRLAEMDFAKIRDLIGAHLLLALYVARYAANKVRPGGTLIFMGGTGGRRPAIGMSIASAVTAALPALTALTGATYDIDGGQQFVAA